MVGIWVGESWDIVGGTRRVDENIVDWRGISGERTDKVEGGVHDRFKSDDWDSCCGFGCLKRAAAEVGGSDISGCADIPGCCFASGCVAEEGGWVVFVLLSPNADFSRLKTPSLSL